ncbi:MAG: hypothetical protein HY235_00705 [Acidobacteria bacterium]|nr:hypothetical protein [Acidobacteriota bacterium]
MGRLLCLLFASAGGICRAQIPFGVCQPRFRTEVTAEPIESSYRIAPGGLTGLLRAGQPADIMLSGFGFNQSGGGLMFHHNSGLATDGTRLLLADRGNNRVLIWSRLPEANEPPDVVLGQPDLDSNDSGEGRHQLNWPIAVATDGVRIVVADTFNDRLLIWNSFPAQNGAPADFEIRIPWPWGVWTNGQKLVATSTGTGVALIWNTFPSRENQPHDIRLRAGGMFGTPRTITSNGQFLMIGDHNARATEIGQGNYVWKRFPETEDTPYDFFLTDPMDERYAWMQGDFLPDGRLAVLGSTLHLWNTAPAGAADKPAVSIRAFSFSGGDGSSAVAAGNRLFISGANGNRVLVYRSFPDNAEQTPDFALGSPDLCTNTLDANFLITNPVPSSNGKSLFVSSDFDRRLYVWKRLPDESGVRPDLVYHLPEPAWQNALWQDTLALAGARTVVVWRNLPLEGQRPDVILRERIGSVQLRELRGVAYDGRFFYLSDFGAGRVYVWEGIPTANSEPKFSLAADRPTRLHSDGTWLLVVRTEGQQIQAYRVDSLSADARPQSIGGPGRFNLPEHAIVSSGKLFVADTVFNRVHVWNRMEDAIAGRDADLLLGSPDRRTQTRQNGLFWPGGLSFDGSYLWVGEFKFSGRLLRYSVQPGAPLNGTFFGTNPSLAPAATAHIPESRPGRATFW